MNNNFIIKYILSSKVPTIKYYIDKKHEEEMQDEEIYFYYVRGYFNPFDYEKYINRTYTYQQMMQLMADRMNDNYYYGYVEDMYNDGWLSVDDWENYDFAYFLFDIGEVGYDWYIDGGSYTYDDYTFRWMGLESLLQIINYNILNTEPE